MKAVCRSKRVNVDIDKLLELDKSRLSAMRKIEEISAKKNTTSRLVASESNPERRNKIIAEMKVLDQDSDSLKDSLKTIEEEFDKILNQVPNMVLDDVPEGKDETENKVVSKWGAVPKFKFPPKNHLEIGEKLGIIDVERASKVVGTRSSYLKGEGALLEFALVQYALNILTSKAIIKKIANSVKKGYSDKVFLPIIPPIMIRPDVLKKMARLSEEDKDERYYLPKDDLYLTGSAEHTLGPLHMDEIIKEDKLPIRYVGFSTSLRREAGSYGKDTKGILRVHQFDKVEMESFTLPELSILEQNFFVALQEYIVKSLRIPYQVVMICTGDMGKPDARQVDIECWMPGQDRYRETHTSDLMTDYQARRLNTRVRRKNGNVEIVHMNDATVFAIGRILIAIIENYQQKDGGVKVPAVLQKYLSFKEIKIKK